MMPVKSYLILPSGGFENPEAFGDNFMSNPVSLNHCDLVTIHDASLRH